MISLTDAETAIIQQAHDSGKIDANYMTMAELKEYAHTPVMMYPYPYGEGAAHVAQLIDAGVIYGPDSS